MSIDNALEWLSSNVLISYPFKEDASRVSVGGFEIPRDVLIDAVILGGDEDDRIYLSDLITTPTELHLFFSSVNLATVVASFEIPRVEASVKTLFHSEPVDPIDSVSLNTYEMRILPGPGLLTLLDALDEDFTADAGELEPSVVHPRPARVLSLASELSVLQRLVGDVLIGDGFNMEVVLDEDTNTLTFNSGPGLGLGPYVECEEFREVPRRIRFINGLQGDSNTRSFRVEGDDCIEIRHYPEDHMLALHDHCRPCCDCDRLVDLDTRITALETP